MRFVKGDNRDYPPLSPIMLKLRFRIKLDILRRIANGDNRDYAPISPKQL